MYVSKDETIVAIVVSLVITVILCFAWDTLRLGPTVVCGRY